MRELVKIKEKIIVGIRNPQLRIYGIDRNRDDKFKIIIDGNEVKHKFYRLDTKGTFLLKCSFTKDKKNVDIYYDDEKIYSLKNITIKRIILKFYTFIRGIYNISINKILKTMFSFIRKIYRGIAFLWREHHFLVPPMFWGKYTRILVDRIKRYFDKGYYNLLITKDYNNWIKENQKEMVYKDLKYKPLISILIPVYNIEKEYLSDCLDSILNQKYENFEVCLADDCSTLNETLETLDEYSKKDSRIRVIRRKTNGHIANATNTALKHAKGEFVALMDDDDILTEDALYQMVAVLNKNKKLDFIYSDEDKMNMDGSLCEPHFKPDYSPDSLLGGNYICHFEIIRKKIVEEVGGEVHELVGAQDFDLFLKVVEKTKNIYHIPKVLYHWRKVPGSTADTIDNKEYAIIAGKKAVEYALKRRGLKANVEVPISSTNYVVRYTYDKEPMISIIIPTKDNAELLSNCIDSVYDNTNYENYEIIVIDNNSIEKETIELFNKYKKEHKNFRVIKDHSKFNFSKLNNKAVKKANGEYILLLNNDTKVITPDWLSYMVGYAMQKHIGAVGAELFYKDRTIQHAGVLMGVRGVASHAFINTPDFSYGLYGRLISPYNYSAVTAACLMVSKKKFEQVGGLNEKLEVAYNDVDFCLKLLEKGYYNVMIPSAQLYHYESKTRGLDTTKEKYMKFKEEEKYMYDKWSKYIENDPYYNKNLSKKNDFMLYKKTKKELRSSDE